jgi:methylase of polypeptide subunit release factors
MDTSIDYESALFQVGRWLQRSGYWFVTTTPATHARFCERHAGKEAESMREIFGWSMPFRPSALPPRVLRWLDQSDSLEERAGQLRSKVRFSTLEGALYMHSSYPTATPDAVFFGPDTYRFAALIRRTLRTPARHQPTHIVDVGCGTGAGGIVALRMLRDSTARCALTDINPKALEFARVNVALADVRGVSFRVGSLFDSISEPIDVLLANPPYLVDPDARVYRHGGGELGTGLSSRIVVEGLPRVAPGGTLILYTGSPIVDGIDIFWNSIEPTLRGGNYSYEYSELDPDVFGEELEMDAYAGVERIAVVALVLRKPAT